MAENFTSADPSQNISQSVEVQTQPTTATPTTTMYVHAQSLNIRDKASSSAKSIGKLLRGAQVEVVGKITPDGWALLANVVGEPPALKKFVRAKAGKTDYLSTKKPAPLKKTVKPPPPPPPQAEDQPPPPPQDTQESSGMGLIVPVGVLALLLLLWMRRK